MDAISGLDSLISPEWTDNAELVSFDNSSNRILKKDSNYNKMVTMKFYYVNKNFKIQGISLPKYHS